MKPVWREKMRSASWLIREWQLDMKLMFKRFAAWLLKLKRHVAAKLEGQWETIQRSNGKRKIAVEPVQQKKAAQAYFFLAAKPVTATHRQAFPRKP